MILFSFFSAKALSVAAILCFEAKKEVTCSAVNSAVLVYDSTAIDEFAGA